MLWQLVAIIILVLLQVANVSPTFAASALPAVTKQKIIVHGAYSAGGQPARESAIDAGTAALLDEAIRTAEDNNDAVIVIVDASGDDPAQVLHRTASLRNYLADHGIAVSRISVDPSGGASVASPAAVAGGWGIALDTD